MFLPSSKRNESHKQPTNGNERYPKDSRIRDHLLSLRFAILIFALSLFLKLWETSSIKMWDEGWYADISARMADTIENGGDWAFPVYEEFGALKMFDKPPLLFWVTGLLINLLGRSTLALKLPIAFSGAMLAAIAYFLYSGDRSDRTAGALAGLMMACAYFVNFYSRTAYIDITMVFLSSLTVLFAKRAIDAIVDRNDLFQGLVFLVLTGIVNALDLLLKAWQGLVVGPAIGLYLLVKVYQKEGDSKRISRFFRSFQPPELMHRVCTLFSRDSTKPSLLVAIFALTAVFLGILGIVEDWIVGLVCLIPVIGVYLVALAFSEFPEDDQLSSIDLILLGVVLGILSSFITIFLLGAVEPYYQVLEDLAHGIGDSAGGYAVNYLGLPSKILGTTSKEFLGNLLSGIFVIIPIVTVLAGLASLTGAFAVFLLGVLGEPKFQRFIRDNFIPMVPTLLLGSWMVFWATQVVLGGMFFDHDPIPTVILGIIVAVSILAFFVVLSIVIRDQQVRSTNNSKNKGESIRELMYRLLVPTGFALSSAAMTLIGFLFLYSIFNVDPWFAIVIGVGILGIILIVPLAISKTQFSFKAQNVFGEINTRQLLAGVAVIVAVLSFLPFLGWIDYVSRNISKLSYLDASNPVRRPGELPRDIYEQHKEDIIRWFFFDYYVGWRYDNPSPNEEYSMWNAVHSAFADPIFVAMIPIFFIGIFAFYRRKKIADGLLYTSWFFTTLLIFLPAAFQLNYYYLACFLPFYLVVAQGVVYMFHEARSPLVFEYLAVFIGVLVFGFILHKYDIITYDLLSIELQPFINVKSRIIPSGPHLKNIELLVLSVGVIVSLSLLFWIRKDLNVVGLALIFLVVFSSLIAISYNIKVGEDWDPRLEEIADFILAHEGGYNESTWVFSDAGIEYSLRYYLGYEIFRERGPWGSPFHANSSAQMQWFVDTNPQIKFWVVLNDTYRDKSLAETQAYYSEAYLWLKENFQCVDDQIGIPEWLDYHVFADPDVL